MSNLKSKLRLAGAVAALATLALAASCRGFFVNPTLSSIAINPTAPEVQLNSTLPLQAYGTYSDNNRRLISSGVSWSSNTPTVATIDPNSGVLTGVSAGTSTITASAQGLSTTATATVYLGGVSSMTVTPSSGTATVSTSQTASFAFVAISNGTQIPITTDTGGVLTISPTTSFVSCTASGNDEICSASSGVTFQNYSIVMTYPGTTASATATLSVPN